METILPRIGAPAIEPLKTLMDRSGPDVRKNVIRVLKQFRNPQVIQPLLKGFGDTEALTAEWALEGLQRNSSPVIVEPLLEHMNIRSRLQPEIAFTLGTTREPDVFQPLVDILEANAEKALTFDDYNFRVAGYIRELGKLGDPRAVEIIKGLPEPEADHLTLIPAKIDAMYWIGSPQAVDALTSYEIKSWSRQPWKNESTGRLLECVYESSAFEKIMLLGMKPQLTEHVRMRLIAMEKHGPCEKLLLDFAVCRTEDDCIRISKQLLGCSHEMLIDPLIALFEHPDARIRSAAAAILGRIGRSTASVNILSPVYQTYEETASAVVRKHAVEVIGLARVKRWLTTLQLDLYSEKDPDILKALQWAVGQIESGQVLT
jgi:HEAT repeat protein